jgi:class 3 adenylate cyclase
MELLAERDPEDARKLLDPVLERMMEAIHRYEGTVNQVMGDGIMALFGAPVAHEDHAVRACYGALDAREYPTVRRRAAAHSWRAGADPIRPQLGRGGGSLHRVGSSNGLHGRRSDQALAARMEQMARPGSILLIPDTLGRLRLT